ncbi:MAG TPA: hypothetical protein VGR27_13520, partial [Longimicrobiaceae bacterium]|nr:hypothetical protein [Longimicrobiaceae bacterium]
MHRYSVFGGSLLSAVAFPELRPRSDGSADWTLLHAEGVAPEVEAELLGEDQVDVSVRVRLFRLAAGFRLVYDDTGTFDVIDQGTRIRWHPGAEPRPEAVRLDVLGRVLPVALHASGALCLHGSAVAIEGRGIAFLAPKLHGKSTLAQAMVSAGARMASDDVVPVYAGHPPRMAPGVPSARLWSDALEHLGARMPSGIAADEKHTLDLPPDERLMLKPLPLAAVYLLKPTELSAGEAPAHRTQLPPLQAALALLREAKLGALLGQSEAGVLL